MLDVGFNRGDVEEEIAVVTVQLGNIVISLLPAAAQAFLHSHYIIRVTLVDREDCIQRISSIHGVAGPCDIAEIILVALIEDEVYAKTVGLDIVYGVSDKARISVAGFIEYVDCVLLVVDIFLFVEFLAAEEIVYIVGLGLLHRLRDLEFADVLVAYEVDGADLYLLPPVDCEIDTDCIVHDCILAHFSLDRALKEPFLGIEPLDDVIGGLLHVL